MYTVKTRELNKQRADRMRPNCSFTGKFKQLHRTGDKKDIYTGKHAMLTYYR